MEGESRPHSGRRWWRRHFKWIFVLILILLASPFCLTLIGYNQWSPINCWSYEVDINSGRIRYTRYFTYMRVRQKIEESALSRVLQPDDYYGPEPSWQRVVTLSPMVHYSPNYFYGPAISQIQELELVWKVDNFTPAARRSSAKQLLEIWHRGEGARVASPYLNSLVNFSPTNNSVDEKDLPITR